MPAKKDPKDHSSKKSVSMGPAQWNYVEQKAGPFGNYSRVIQVAVKKMMEEDGIIIASDQTAITPNEPVSYKKTTRKASKTRKI